MRVLLLIRSLDVGGTEGQLVLLADGLLRAGHSVVVAVLYPGGALEKQLRQSGVPTLSLDKRRRYEIVGVALRLARVIRRDGIEVIYSTLNAANAFAAAARVLVPAVRVVWSLRASNMDLRRYDRWTQLTSALEPRLSRLSDRIIVNSRAGLEHAAASGFSRDKMTVIRNGIDTDRFRADPEGRARIRAEWKIAASEPLVALVGRFDPMKDHRTFLAACVRLKERVSNAWFVCVGDGAEPRAQAIRDMACSLGLESRMVWPGLRADMPSVYAAIDVLVSASSGEGLPNVVAEAMACETPCVVTDVGDAAWLVGDTGIVVPPGTPAQLADGIESTLRQPPSAAQRHAMRRRVIDHLGIDRLVRETEAVLRSAIEAD